MYKSIVAILLTLTSISFGYQVTGPVVEVTETKIVIEKDKEKWELAKDAATKVDGEIKVGTKVTAEYSMTATKISAKADKKAKK